MSEPILDRINEYVRTHLKLPEDNPKFKFRFTGFKPGENDLNLTMQILAYPKENNENRIFFYASSPGGTDYYIPGQRLDVIPREGQMFLTYADGVEFTVVSKKALEVAEICKQRLFTTMKRHGVL